MYVTTHTFKTKLLKKQQYYDVTCFTLILLKKQKNAADH